MCVQNFDDSRRYAIRITYRISLRSSSLCEPRHPLLKVVRHLRIMWGGCYSRIIRLNIRTLFFFRLICLLFLFLKVLWLKRAPKLPWILSKSGTKLHNFTVIWSWKISLWFQEVQLNYSSAPTINTTNFVISNDPSAGSPTETLLRLHLPLNDKVWENSSR